ncbi:hypothetical protein [Rufibacter roseus]|uniref:Uncharacterized protein n=1 Tax=Rufibacter roseus TaxID=1567108 RepID=A0ABW2DN05_9BACT|nr:hypothetical protein [Rufibacter roseus]
MAKYLLFGFIFFIAFTCHSQTTDTASNTLPTYRYLLLSKAGTVKRYRIQIGETITYQLKGSKRWQSDLITDIRGTSFFIQHLEIPLARVERVQLQNHTGGRKLAAWTKGLLQGAGGLFVLIGGINFFYYSEDRSDGLQTMGAAAATYALGSGIGRFRKGNYKIGDTWMLKVMEMY